MTPYALYNEIDPYAADWLENLIKADLIAPGIVDRRSIEDLRGDDLRGFRQVHFFAGIGVWSYGLRRAGVSDDTAVWTGSCPCQPFSAAGKGGGVDDERHLWPAFLHLIRECHPDRVLGEQVASKDGLGWLDAVWTDLEAEGYALGPLDTCSAGSGAPHIRQRLRFFAYNLRPSASGVAHSEMRGQSGRLWERGQTEWPEGSARGHGASGGLAYDRRKHGKQGTSSEGPVEPSSREWWEDTVHAEPCGGALGVGDDDGTGCESGVVTEDEPARSAEPPDTACGMANDDRDGQCSAASAGLFDATHNLESCNCSGSLADSNGQRSSQWDGQPGGKYDTNELERLGAISYSRGPGPTNGFWRDADWLLCRDDKWRPVEPGTFPLVDGSAFRVGSGSPFEGKSRQGMLKAYGNAIDAEATIDFIEACLAFRPVDHLAAGSLDLSDLLG